MLILFTFLVVLTIAIFLLSIKYRAEDHSIFDSPQAPLIKPESEVSAEHEDVVAKLHNYHKNSSLDVKKARLHMETFFKKDYGNTSFSPITVNGVPCEWVRAEGASSHRRLLYIHGGAFRIGSPKSHRYLTSELSRLSGLSVLSVDYRMQPEFKRIHCNEDVRKTYEWIIKNGPEGEEAISEFYIAGDSAGGNLTLAVIAWAKKHGIRPVDGAIAMAPLTDSSLGGTSWVSNKTSDPFLGPSLGKLTSIPRSIMGLIMRLPTGTGVNDPEVSPLLGDLTGLPKTLIQVSKHEMLFDDSQRYANKASAAGNDITLQVWPKMVHIFQAFGPELPEANEALEKIQTFIASCKPKTEEIDQQRTSQTK